MKISYCRKCGEHLVAKKKEGKERKYCKNCGEYRYKSPDPSVGVIVTRNSEALVIKRGIEPNKGKWSVPAGFIEYGEDPRQAAARELKEETNLRVNPHHLELSEVFSMRYSEKTVTPIIFSIDFERVDGQIDISEEVSGLEWMTRSEMDAEKEKFETKQIYKIVEEEICSNKEGRK